MGAVVGGGEGGRGGGRRGVGIRGGGGDKGYKKRKIYSLKTFTPTTF